MTTLAAQPNFDLNPGFRHTVVASGGSGTGAELDDGRLLYVWEDGGAIKRGWLDSLDAAVTLDLPPMTGAATLATGLAGSPSISRVTNGNVGMFVTHKPGSGASTGVTGSGSFPSLAVGVSYLESDDDGATWTLVGTGSVGNTASSIGLGQGVETGPVLDLGGGVMLCAANYFGNYFGDSTPNPGIYRTTNGGASWTAVHTPDGGPFSGSFSRNFAEDPGGVLWWGAKGGGFGTPYWHLYHSADGGATWVDDGDAGLTWINVSHGYDARQALHWGYGGSGLLEYGPTADAIDLVVDKIAWDIGYPYPSDMGQPALVVASRDRTVAYAQHYVDLVTSQTGWQVNRIGFS